MRCLSCNNILDEAEESLTYEWDEPIELCLDCLEDTEIPSLYNEQQIKEYYE